MAKRKRKKQRTSQPGRRARTPRRSLQELQATLRRAERLIESDRGDKAIDLLEPLLSTYPRSADLHYFYGYACVSIGDLVTGLQGYERAMQLSRNPELWLPLAWLYEDLELDAHALRAIRQALKRGIDPSEVREAQQMLARLEGTVRELAGDLGLPVSRVERGLRYMESGGRALDANDYSASIAASRQAIRLLGDWPPPLNNLSLALFYDGQPRKAIDMARKVLSQHPDNVQALANAIRFLAWMGQQQEARALWASLAVAEPRDARERIKIAEAAAVLEQDEAVHALLKPLDGPGAEQLASPLLYLRVQHFLAVAEANLGRRTARRRLKKLPADMPWVQGMLDALQKGQPGIGWADRFPYFAIHEYIPWERMEEFLQLAGREDELPDHRFQQQMERFVERFPQLVLAAEKLLWEEQQAEVAIALLEMIGTPAAHDALGRFGLGQAGDLEDRLEALASLAEAGEIAPDEKLRVWKDGEWQEIQLRQYEISDEVTWDYAPELIELLNRGLAASEREDAREAERLFRRVLEADPTVKEAYNNLAAIYGQRGDVARAKEMCEKALEIDPLYVHPRCNLALQLLSEDDVEGAVDTLRVLDDVTQFHPLDMAFYNYTQARVHIHRKEYDQARNALQAALDVWPGYELAEDALARLEVLERVTTSFDSYFERRRKREQASRARLQAKLTNPEPALSEALSIYTKEMLTGMGRVVLPWGGWSALRKAELRDKIVEALGDAPNVERMVLELGDVEEAALRQVLARGGSMPWHEFDAAYGNDLEESRYWQWHKPTTVMGRLRLHGLLVEATVDGELLVTVPLELRSILDGIPSR